MTPAEIIDDLVRDIAPGFVSGAAALRAERRIEEAIRAARNAGIKAATGVITGEANRAAREKLGMTCALLTLLEHEIDALKEMP